MPIEAAAAVVHPAGRRSRASSPPSSSPIDAAATVVHPAGRRRRPSSSPSSCIPPAATVAHPARRRRCQSRPPPPSLRLPCIVKLVDSVLSSKQLAWRQTVLNLFMLAEIVMMIFTFSELPLFSMIVCQFGALVVVSSGNFQIPAAIVRVILALLRIVPQNYFADGSNGKQDSEKNLKPSLNIFYGMVLGQGILYIVACLLEVFSFIPRRSLVRHGGFGRQLGVEYVNLYYAYAFEKCVRGPVLAPKKISLITFAMDSLNSDSSRNKLYEKLRIKTITKLTNGTKTIASLFDLLGWTSNADADIRLCAAKVTADLAGSVRVVQIPGAMQLIASLLDIDQQPKISNHFLFIESQEGREDSSVQQVGMGEHNSVILKYLKKMAIYCLIPVDEPSNIHEQNPHILRCWRWITRCWSVPEEELSMDQDSLPVQGLLILERLANFDLGNCMEISRAPGLISKMIDFTSYTNCSVNEEHQIMLAGLSLRVLRTLASTKGKSGVSLRQDILEHPFLLSNLAEILDDRGSSHGLKQLAAEILKNLAMDRNTSEDIGHIRLIIRSLMREFLSRDASSSTNSNHLLQKIAGQALAMLAMESANNCLIMLMEPGYAFIKELTTLIHDERNKYTAASMLWNMCEQARTELNNSDLKELSYTLREVLEGIMNAEGAELEVLIGLSSQICIVIPENFVRELEHGQIKENFVKRLVNALNANKRPSAHCPSIRRVIVQHSIYLMEFNSCYANDFRKCGMVEALSMVEVTPSRAENYRGEMLHPLENSVAMANTTAGAGFGEQYTAASSSSRGKRKVAAPEKQLNRFVHSVAVTERLGNALGTLAFTWATVVLLGGYPTVLRPGDDFWFATTIVFLEAARMFSSDNRLDYQLFFSTRGAFRLLGWNGLLTVIVHYSAVLVILYNYYHLLPYGGVMVPLLLDMVMLVALGQMLSPGALKLVRSPVRCAISLWSPLLGVILMGPCIPQPKYDFRRHRIILKNSTTRWILYLALFLIVFLTTISRLQFPCIVQLVGSVLSKRQLAWCRLILNLSMLAAIVMLVFTFDEIQHQVGMMVYQVSALLVVSFGNFQIPAAVVRVVLALIRLFQQNYVSEGDNGHQDGLENLNPSLNIFYGMVLGQGSLYIVACILEIFSFIPRRSLIRHGGFKGRQGVEYANLYYAYAFEKCMGGNVFAPKNISIVTFAMDSLNSDSSRKKLYGVQMLHSFLRKEQLRAKTIPKLTSSTKTVASLFNMLGWTSDGDADVRLFAAKVTADLAGSLRVVAIPGAMQNVASLLHTDHQPKIRDHFLFSDNQEAREDPVIQQVGMVEQNSPVIKYWKQMVIYLLIPVDEPSNIDEMNLSMLRCWRWIKKYWSIPEEEPSTDQDFLPVQGLIILERLASFDPGNCIKISRVTGLISKMIDFTSYRNHMTSIKEAHQIMLAVLSLRVLRALELTTMIHDGRYKYTAVSLLRSLCEHAQPEINNSDLMELSYIIQESVSNNVFTNHGTIGSHGVSISNAEGAELEVLIGLSSQICIVVPDDFARALEHSQIKKKFVKRLVGALNAHLRPNADCPGIRRVIVQHAIYLMEFDSRYANDFHKCWMVEALSMVENTSTRLENYRLFSGDVGLMEHGTPLSTLVARAKELMGREHRLQMPPAHGGGRQVRQVSAPEKWLNCFVRVVALTERVGNALGTLAFTWATVVLLGGYPTVLRPDDDFYYATSIIFIEATRMFSRNNRIDYQLFFRTRGAFRPSSWNEFIVLVACISNALICTIPWIPYSALLLAMGPYLCSAASRLLVCKPIRRAISLWSPMVAILFLGLFVLGLYTDSPQRVLLFIPKITMAKSMYVVLLAVVLLLTISRFRFPSIIKLLNATLGSKQVIWRRIYSELVHNRFALLIVEPRGRILVSTKVVYALLIVSLGNLQIPAAIVRVALALLRLIPQDYEQGDTESHENKTNLAASLNIFYGMVLGQGILYIAACIFEFFSFIPRRYLIRHGGFGGQWGVASVNLYYAYAFEKYMEGGMLAPKKTSLITFAMESLNSDSPKMQQYGVQMLHIFLQKDPTRLRLIAKLTTSRKTMSRLISMLGWTSPNHKTVRVYAAKATVELAKCLPVITVPGTVRLVSALLNKDDGGRKNRNPLLDADVDHEGEQDSIHNAADGHQERQDVIGDAANDQCQIQDSKPGQPPSMNRTPSYSEAGGRFRSTGQFPRSRH
uniref:Uncharacterized protein n=1 Tax=Oryza meridionalis TaxID=40149 RepID=A0A0E0EFB3_9ORYZ